MDGIRRGLRIGLVLLALLLVFNIVTIRPGTVATFRVLAANVLQGNVGTGMWNGVQNPLDFSQLEPGDIILGHNPGCTWGYYTHATLYLGNGQVMETLLTTGAATASVEHYHDYTGAAILRVNLPKDVKERAVQAALSLRGRPFLLLAPRQTSDWFYCTKAVWWAYKQAGYDLDPDGSFWVVPDQFPKSPFVTVVAKG